MRRIALGGMLMCAALGVMAATLDEGFRSVPVAERPWCYWWWINGHATKRRHERHGGHAPRGLRRTADVRRAGLLDDQGHLVLPETEMEFMSPEWREMRRSDQGGGPGRVGGERQPQQLRGCAEGAVGRGARCAER
jgi:hypothetical protein